MIFASDCPPLNVLQNAFQPNRFEIGRQTAVHLPSKNRLQVAVLNGMCAVIVRRIQLAVQVSITSNALRSLDRTLFDQWLLMIFSRYY